MSRGDTAVFSRTSERSPEVFERGVRNAACVRVGADDHLRVPVLVRTGGSVQSERWRCSVTVSLVGRLEIDEH